MEDREQSANNLRLSILFSLSGIEVLRLVVFVVDFQSSFHWVRWHYRDRFGQIRGLSILFSLRCTLGSRGLRYVCMLSILFSLSCSCSVWKTLWKAWYFQSSFHWAMISSGLWSNTEQGLSILFSLSPNACVIEIKKDVTTGLSILFSLSSNGTEKKNNGNLQPFNPLFIEIGL